MKWLNHLKTINHHKRLVMKYCFRCGLYKQGILHDLSKYSWSEFKVGAKYYQGTRSPNAAEREATGVSMAWLHHKGRNKHHIEYWVDYNNNPNESMVGMEIPVKYIVEMFCDRIAAGKTYKKEKYTDRSPLEYLLFERHRYIMNPKSDQMLYDLMKMLADSGEEKTFHYIRTELLKNKKQKSTQ